MPGALKRTVCGNTMAFTVPFPTEKRAPMAWPSAEAAPAPV